MKSEVEADDPAAAMLRHMEYTVMVLDQVHEQMADLRSIQASLSRIEKAAVRPKIESRRPSGSAGIASAQGDYAQACEAALQSSGMHGVLDMLEESMAERLQGLRRKSRHRQKSSSSGAASSGKLRPLAPPEVDVANLHEPSSHESPTPLTPKGPAEISETPKGPAEISESFSCVSVEPPRLHAGPQTQPAGRVVPVPELLSPPLASRASTDPSKLRRKSLDNIRAANDAAIAAPGAGGPFCSPRSSETFSEVVSAIPRMGWLLLCMVGILDFFQGRRWRYLAWCSLATQMSGVCGLVIVLSSWHGAIKDIEPLLTTVLYFLGALVAVLSLRRNKITSLLGPNEFVLDEFAAKSDFLADWRKVSRARLLQISCFFVLMLSFRGAALLWTQRGIYGRLKQVPLFDAATMVAFGGMAVCYCAACYCVLHITAGLELAVDSFAVQCFSTGDMETAVINWNVVQATLRQTSCKLTDFLVLLASSCMVALTMFAYQVVSITLTDERVSMLDIVIWTGWLYSPVLLFLYVLSTTAAVTERVDRVAPLVNSWTFEDQAILDTSRQYVVQYILNSRAGFYARGIRITASSVQKLCYYFAAGSFGLLANLWK